MGGRRRFSEDGGMAKSSTVQRLRRESRSGKKPTTQAGEIVREAGQKLKRAGRKVRARTKQGVAEARRSGSRALRGDGVSGARVRSPGPVRSRGRKNGTRTTAGRKRAAARLTRTRRRW